MDGYVDNLHERFEHDEESYLSEYSDPDNNWDYVEGKALVNSYPAELGFVYTHDAIDGDPNVTPPKSAEEIKEIAEKSFQLIYDTLVSKGIYLDGHADWKANYDEWTEPIHDEQDHINEIKGTIHILKDGEWKPYSAPKLRSKLRTR